MALLATLVLAGGVGAASAAANTTCASTLTSISLNGDVRVPRGQTCTLIDSTVSGNVTIEEGAALVGQGATINGNVQSTGGTVSLGPDTSGRPSRVGANVQTNGGGSVTLTSARVSGNVQTQGGGPVTLISSRVQRDVQISGEPDPPSPNVICASTIGGNLQVQHNATQSIIGDPLACGSGGGNHVSGNMEVHDNSAGGMPAALVSDNSVSGNLQCQSNKHPATGQAGSNTVGGTTQGECVAEGAETECTSTSPTCTAGAESADGTAALTVKTASPTSGTEQIIIAFGPPPLGCTTPGTGDVATFYVTNAGPGDKTVTYYSLGPAADAAEAAHPITFTEGKSSFGFVCYESPTSFTTFSGASATPGPEGFFGQLPACDKTGFTPPCVESAEFFTEKELAEKGEKGGFGDVYITTFLTSQSDPRASH